MTQTKFKEVITELSAREREILFKKNAKYAKEDNAFSAFESITKRTNGRISVEDSILCRIDEKIERLSQLISGNVVIDEETVEDTLMDISGYTKIWIAFRQEKLNYDKADEALNKLRKFSNV